MLSLKKLLVKLSIIIYIVLILVGLDFSLSLFLLKSSSPELNKLYKKNIFNEVLGINTSLPYTTNNLTDDEKSNASWMKNYVLHPYLGFVNSPKNSSNQYGFWSDDPVAEREDNEVVVALSGGSVSAMLYGEAKDQLIKELSQLPLFQGKKIRLVSFANGGYKQPQQLIALNYFISIGAKFDMIINLDGFNEITADPDLKTPYYPGNWPVLTQNFNNNDNLSALSDLYLIKKKRQRWSSIAALLKESQIFILSWHIFDNNLQKQEYVLLSRLSQNTSNNFQTYGPQPILDKNEFIKKSIDVWRESSIQMAKISKANNILYYQFLQPNQYFIGSKPLTQTEKLSAFVSSSDNTVDQYYPQMIRLGNELKNKLEVNFIDLTQIYKNNQDTLYIDTCCHVNEQGNKIMASAIVQSIATDLKQ